MPRALRRASPHCAGFYLSFEDALWALFAARKIEPGSSVLLPAFFCTEVMQNLRKHGFEVRTYRLDARLRCDRAALDAELEKHPDVLILFRALGLDCPAPIELSERVSGVKLIVEDCAHALIDPAQVRIEDSRHAMIDCLRKVTPLQGSHLYVREGPKGALGYSRRSWGYRFRAMGLYLLWRLVFLCARLTSSAEIWSASERLFERFNSTIGTGSGAPGTRLEEYLFRCIDLDLIKERRVAIGRIYRNGIERTCGSGGLLIDLDLAQEELCKLKFYPLRSSRATWERLKPRLESRGIFLDLMYDDSPQCGDEVYVMLPLAPDLTAFRAEALVRALGEALHAA